jgi:hypothetical protein
MTAFLSTLSHTRTLRHISIERDTRTHAHTHTFLQSLSLLHTHTHILNFSVFYIYTLSLFQTHTHTHEYETRQTCVRRSIEGKERSVQQSRRKCSKFKIEPSNVLSIHIRTYTNKQKVGVYCPTLELCLAHVVFR